MRHPAAILVWARCSFANITTRCFSGYMTTQEISEAIRTAPYNAKAAEGTEIGRVEKSETAELWRSASARVAARQAAREALDDILNGHH